MFTKAGMTCSIVFAALILAAILPLSATAQPNETINLTVTAVPMARLANVSNATVTLYYYDQSTGEKGGIVPMPDNPQQVLWDSSKAAPGMYTFSKVPTDQWYYLEANNSGNMWYAVFYMAPGEGTHTANVAIPPFQRLNNTTATLTPTPIVVPTVLPNVSVSTPGPTSGTPQPTPGITGALTIMALAMAVFLIMKKNW